MERILMCSQQFSAGGISSVVRALKDSLICLGCSVDVMAPSYSTGDVAVRIPSLKVPGLVGSVSYWQLATKAARRRRKRYDLVFMHHPVLPTRGLDLGSDNTIVTFHGTYYGYAEAYRSHELGGLRTYYSIATWIERRLLTYLSHCIGIKVTGVSPSTISELQANAYTGPAHFVPNGMPSVGEIVDKKQARDTLRRIDPHFSLDPEDIVVLCVGRIDRQKNPLVLPSLLTEVSASNTNTKFVVAGQGSLSGNLITLAKRTDRLLYLGFVPQERLHLLYSAADAFISLSCYEGLPISVLEAISYGLPLILSDIQPHRWILSERIGFGILIDSFNPIDDAGKVVSMLESTRDSRYYPDYETRRTLTWDAIANDYLKLAEME